MPEATIRDVARRAAVSVASVSRALNKPAAVRPELRERILEAVAELNYSPHAGARSLSMRSNQAIGVVLPDLHGEFFSELVRGMDREASAQGYQLLLSTMHADAAMAASALRAMRGRVDGLIAMAPQLGREEIAAVVPTALPAVLINSAEGSGRHLLRIDNRRGASAVLRHFVAEGRQAPVHIAGPKANLDAIERAEAFRDAVATALPGTEAIVLAGDFSEEAGRAAVDNLVRAGVAFDALFAANDMMALGAIAALRDAGRRVPEDVAVAGFDDIPLARYLGLTTVRVRMDELGSRAVAHLIAELRGEERPRGIELIEPTLIVRGSSGRPA